LDVDDDVDELVASEDKADEEEGNEGRVWSLT
jgi:hypothetical protein